MHIQWPIYLSILAAMCWSGAAFAAPSARAIPDCAGPVEIARAHVIRVEQNGALILDDGRAVTLEGIRLPMGAADHAPRYVADEALAALTKMAQAAPITFTATPPKEDRYDRVRAQGFSDGWLQTALLEQGLARVQISPDRSDCAPDLYEAEARARKAGRGLWGQPAYHVRGPQELKGDIGTFAVVEGTVTDIGGSAGRVFIDFSSDWSRGFSITIAPEDRGQFRGFDFDSLTARHVRVRGLVQDFKGRPEIALSNPGQIEVLD